MLLSCIELLDDSNFPRLWMKTKSKITSKIIHHDHVDLIPEAVSFLLRGRKEKGEEADRRVEGEPLEEVEESETVIILYHVRKVYFPFYLFLFHFLSFFETECLCVASVYCGTCSV